MAKRAYEPASIRTFAVVGHRSSGKTSLGDVLLQTAGVTRLVGRVDERTSLLDHEPEERQRAMTLGLSFAWLEWDETLLQIVDTPGSEGLAHERTTALSGVDAALVVISAPDGVEFGTEQALYDAARMGVPRVVVLNKMDRSCDPESVRTHLERVTGLRVVPMQLPFYDEQGRFAGVVSLLQRRVLRYDPEGGGTYSVEPLPETLAPAAEAAWEHVMESVALTDDELLEHYLEYLELPVEMVQQGMARAMRQGLLIPLLYASALQCIGAHAVLDLAPWALPRPGDRPMVGTSAAGSREIDIAGPFVARMLATRLDMDDQRYHVLRIIAGHPPKDGRWTLGADGTAAKVRKLYQVRGPRRTTAVNLGPGSIVATWDQLPGRPGDVFTDGDLLELPDLPPAPRMVSWLLQATTRRDEHRVDAALQTLCSIDRGLVASVDSLTGQAVLTGATRAHLDQAVTFLETRLGVRVTTCLPPVAYRETPSGTVTSVEGKHLRESDDEVQEFGEVWVDLAPLDPDQQVVIAHKANDEQLPTRFRAAVEQGLREGLMSGPTAGYPVIGARVTCVNGEYDIFMSTEEHFVLAGARAARNAMTRAGSRMLEPWSTLEVLLPADEVGHILNDLAAHRGRILGMEVKGSTAAIRAHCPDRELRDFAARLQSLTGGRGQFTQQHSHYGRLPAQFVKEAIDASPFGNQTKRPDPGTPKPNVREVRPYSAKARPVVRGAKA